MRRIMPSIAGITWARLQREGYPCYTTSAGWLGYSDEKLRRLAQEAVDAGFNHIKLKVGRDQADDIRRLRICRNRGIAEGDCPTLAELTGEVRDAALEGTAAPQG